MRRTAIAMKGTGTSTIMKSTNTTITTKRAV